MDVKIAHKIAYPVPISLFVILANSIFLYIQMDINKLVKLVTKDVVIVKHTFFV